MARTLWIIHKDLVSECRAKRVWPAMLLFGIVTAVVFGLQMDLPPDQKRRVVGGLLWLAIFFAGMLAVDRAFASEREEGCWDGLLLYPIAPTAIYFAKLAVNAIALGALQLVLIPLVAVLSDVPLAAHPWHLFLVAILGNLGITAVATLLSAATAGSRQSGGLLALLVLPLVVPVVLAAAEATRLMSEDDLGGEYWRWVQLLVAFVVIFVTAGSLLFDFVAGD